VGNTIVKCGVDWVIKEENNEKTEENGEVSHCLDKNLNRNSEMIYLFL